MRFYVYIREMTVNGANKTEADYDSLDLAMAKYHSRMATIMTPNDIIGCVALVFDSKGGIYVNDVWGTMEKPSAEEVAES